jgi:hypothetical protein
VNDFVRDDESKNGGNRVGFFPPPPEQSKVDGISVPSNENGIGLSVDSEKG